jgi:hypothetical protein
MYDHSLTNNLSSIILAFTGLILSTTSTTGQIPPSMPQQNHQLTNEAGNEEWHVSNKAASESHSVFVTWVGLCRTRSSAFQFGYFSDENAPDAMLQSSFASGRRPVNSCPKLMPRVCLVSSADVASISDITRANEFPYGVNRHIPQMTDANPRRVRMLS